VILENCLVRQNQAKKRKRRNNPAECASPFPRQNGQETGFGFRESRVIIYIQI